MLPFFSRSLNSKLHLSSDDIDDLFDNNPKHKYALLVFETNSSYVGRKIILDFSLYQDKLVIRHVTPVKNRVLFDKMKIPLDTKPVVYIIKNLEYTVSYESLDSFLNGSNTDVQHNLGSYSLQCCLASSD